MKRKIRVWPLIISIVFIFLTWGISEFRQWEAVIFPTPTFIPTIIESQNKVIRVIDGDTIELTGGERVRYIGIDTPESDECYFQEAKLANEKLVLNQEVKLVKDISQTDKYGRLLRYVYVGGIFVNEYLVKQGYALVTTYPPDVAYVDSFVKAQQEAQNNNRGLWSQQSGCNNNSADSLCLNHLGEAQEEKACSSIPESARFCENNLDCYATCAYGCLSRIWKPLIPLPDCLAEPTYSCGCVDNICQKRQ